MTQSEWWRRAGGLQIKSLREHAALRAIGVAIAGLGLVTLGYPASGDVRPTARIQTGLIQGTEASGVSVFEGVPFAAPPVGALRWIPPQPAKAWHGIRQADRFAPACAYVPYPKRLVDTPTEKALETLYPDVLNPPQSEDCLYLNVWTPAKSARDHLAVMVWIYGGAFNGGTNRFAVYNGARLARKGVVVVSIAFRAGPFGFLAEPLLTKEEGTSGNYGLLDQIAALKWVQRNIAAFGGDPHRVTIFGQSSGGYSVGMLAGSPLAQGLFQRAISESGGWGMSGWPPYNLKRAEGTGAGFFRALGVTNLMQARSLSVAKINKVASETGAWFWPNYDGRVLPEDEYVLFSKGTENGTPILLGFNSDEGGSFPRPTTVVGYVKQVRAQYGAYTGKILSAYPAHSDAEAARSSADLIRDRNFAWSTWMWARLQARSGKEPVYLYYFNHRLPFPHTPALDDLGVTHGSEVPYVFGTFDVLRMKFSARDRALSQTLMSYWTNFAKFGDPNGPGLPHWPAYTAQRPVAIHFDDVADIPGPLPNLKALNVLSAYRAWLDSSIRVAEEARTH